MSWWPSRPRTDAGSRARRSVARPIMKFRIRTPILQSYITSKKPLEPEPTAIAVLQDRLFLPRCSVLQDWFVLRKTRGERGLTSCALFPADEHAGGDERGGSESVLLGRSCLTEEDTMSGSRASRPPATGGSDLMSWWPSSTTDARARARTPEGELDGARRVVLVAHARSGEQSRRGSTTARGRALSSSLLVCYGMRLDYGGLCVDAALARESTWSRSRRCGGG
jgi:hypothetical protein